MRRNNVDYPAPQPVLWAPPNGMLYLLVFCLLSLLLTAGYYLWSMQRTLFGDLTDRIDLEHVHDISKTEFIALGIMVCMIALFGIWPSLATDFITTFTGGMF